MSRRKNFTVHKIGEKGEMKFVLHFACTPIFGNFAVT